MSDQPTVFVVDDDYTVRDALGLFLETSGLRVKTYSSAREFLDDYQASQTGCLVLDIRMPGMSGLELQNYLLDNQIGIPIIFLTGHGDVPQSAQAFKAGAVDFIEKPFEEKQLLLCIQEAISRDRQNRKVRTRDQEIIRRFARLTPREKEVMRYVVSGQSNKEIARLLAISHRTIDVHRARIMEKMHAKSLPDLVTMAAFCDL